MDNVSVVIPCYNAAPFLSGTIESILGQTRPPAEILVIDDGSTDNSVEVAARYGSSVRVLTQPNRGESVARNRGIDEAQEEWVGFCDADDQWAPTKLEAQLALVDKETIGLVTRTLDWQDWEGGTRSVRDEPDPDDWVEFSLRVGAPFQISSLLVRRRLSLRFDEETRFGEDMVYLLDLMFLGQVRRIDLPLTTYRFHRRSQSQSQPLVALKWHRTCREWLARSENRLPQEQRATARRLIDERVLVAAARAYWKRRWNELELIRAYAEGLAESPDLVEQIPRRSFPKLAYRVGDWLASYRRRAGDHPSVRPASGSGPGASGG